MRTIMVILSTLIVCLGLLLAFAHGLRPLNAHKSDAGPATRVQATSSTVIKRHVPRALAPKVVSNSVAVAQAPRYRVRVFQVVDRNCGKIHKWTLRQRI